MKTTMIGGVVLALATVALGVGARGKQAAGGDGKVDTNDVCHGSDDIGYQDEMFRPYGGVLHVPADITPQQLEAVRQAAEIRLANSQGKAVWRIVRGGEPLHVYNDELLLASCHLGDSPNTLATWAWTKPAGGIGIDWSQFAEPFGWPWAIANELKNLEGDLTE